MVLKFSVLDHISVHTVLGLSQCCSWHGRREKGWQPQRTALVLTKGVLQQGKKNKKKPSYIMPALFQTLSLLYCIFSFTLRDHLMSDMAEPVAILNTEILYLPYLWHAPKLYDTICNFFVWFPPMHPPPGFPFSTFFPNVILTYLFPACFPVSHSLCGSSVTTIFLCGRMSFHRGTGGGLGGASSWHARVLVNKTIWL